MKVHLKMYLEIFDVTTNLGAASSSPEGFIVLEQGVSELLIPQQTSIKKGILNLVLVP